MHLPMFGDVKTYHYIFITCLVHSGHDTTNLIVKCPRKIKSKECPNLFNMYSKGDCDLALQVSLQEEGKKTYLFGCFAIYEFN